MTAGENGADGETVSGPESFIDRLRRESARTADGPEGLANAFGVDPGAGPRTDPEIDAEAGLETGEGAGGEGAVEVAPADDSGVEPERRLPPEARRALISLMRQGVVLAPRKARVFEALVRHEAPVRAHLAELYLELVLDESAGVAFIRNRSAEASDGDAADAADDPDGALDDAADTATLISRRTLPLYDTLLLLILRKHYQERQTSGERRVVIDIERVESAFVPFLPLTASDRGERRKLNAAMTRLVDKRLLSRVRGDDERFEITPVIRYVVDAEFLDALLAEYERLAGGSGNAGDSPHEEGVPNEEGVP